METSFIVATERPVADPLAWALAHTAALGTSFEPVDTKVPIPGGREIPGLGVGDGGSAAIVYAVREPLESALWDLAAMTAFLRRGGEWLARRYPEANWGRARDPQLILLAPSYIPSFLEALEGLAVSGVVLLRLRLLESTDGAGLILAERVNPRGEIVTTGGDPADLADQERGYFQALETERWSLSRG